MCPMLAAWCFRERARGLNSSTKEILAKFKKKDQIEYVTNTYASHHLQKAVAKVCDITDKKEL